MADYGKNRNQAFPGLICGFAVMTPGCSRLSRYSTTRSARIQERLDAVVPMHEAKMRGRCLRFNSNCRHEQKTIAFLSQRFDCV